MKKLLAFSFLFMLAIGAFSQNNVFGYEVRNVQNIQVDGAVRDSLTVKTDYMYMQFYNNGRVIFGYNIYYLKNDSTIVRTEMNVRETVPLDRLVSAAGQTKTVLEWIQQTQTAQDTAIIQMLAGKLARYRSIGELNDN